MASSKDAAIVAAFITSGMHECGLDRVYHSWSTNQNGGMIELFSAAAQYAPLLWDLAEMGEIITGDHPGVFDYEVSTEFGKWFANWIVSNKIDPPRNEAFAFIKNSVFVFFNQGGNLEEVQALQLSSAVDLLISTSWRTAP